MNTPAAQPRRHRSGFTLAEVVVSLLILAVVVVAAGSALTVADNGAGPQATRWLAQAQSADAAAQVADDLNVALTFTERTATATTFTVPDRVSSGSPNTVRYAWSGVAGAPVTRQFNGGPAVAVLPAAKSFGLVCQTRTAGPAAGAAFTLPSWNAPGAMLANYSITSTAWAAQAILPTLPPGTASYSITRVQVPLKANAAADGVLFVRLTTADASGRPTTTVVGTAVVYECQLSASAYEMIDVPFANVSGLTPGQTYCMSVGYLFGTGTIGMLQYIPNTVSGSYGVPMSYTTNGGASWVANGAYVFQPFNVYGTVP